MLRLLTIIAISSRLFAADILQESDISSFLSKSLSSGTFYTLEKAKLHTNAEVDYPKGWRAYFVTLDLKVKDREVVLRDIIFSDGVSVVKDFTVLRENRSLKEELLIDWDKYVK